MAMPYKKYRPKYTCVFPVINSKTRDLCCLKKTTTKKTKHYCQKLDKNMMNLNMLKDQTCWMSWTVRTARLLELSTTTPHFDMYSTLPHSVWISYNIHPTCVFVRQLLGFIKLALQIKEKEKRKKKKTKQNGGAGLVVKTVRLQSLLWRKHRKLYQELWWYDQSLWAGREVGKEEDWEQCHHLPPVQSFLIRSSTP